MLLLLLLLLVVVVLMVGEGLGAATGVLHRTPLHGTARRKTRTLLLCHAAAGATSRS
jgi:hypothetical protein